MNIKTKKTMDHYKIIFQKSLDAQIIINGSTLEIIEVNEAVQEILGYKCKQLAGKPFSILLPDTSQSPLFPQAEDVKYYGTVFVQEFKRADGVTGPMDMTLTMIPWDSDVVILVTVRDASARIQAEEEREQLIHELQKAMENIKTLKGLIPICMHCLKVRNDDGFWQKVESYVGDHSEAEFSHGICPDCMHKHYPDLFDEKGKEIKKKSKE